MSESSSTKPTSLVESVSSSCTRTRSKINTRENRKKEEKKMSKSETQSPTMVSGNGAYSYSKNSYYQRLTASVVKEKIDEVIAKELDFNTLSMPANTFRLADLGCSIGPNTFHHVQELLEAIAKKYNESSQHDRMPEFQVFFNDQPTNDFNTLFTSLPKDRRYFAAGVPGSFYDRLFPESSLHFVHCSTALHWMSKVPSELLDENSRAWNKGRVHYTGAPREVFDAYASQFAKDMEGFLSARSKELVSGGMIVIITGGIPRGMVYSELQNSTLFDSMSISLLEMVKEGLISEAQVDSFNFPMYAPTPEEVAELVEKNGFFRIERMELTNPATWIKGPVNIPEWVVHVRAAMEGLFSEHFGGEVVDDIFDRVAKNLARLSNQLEAKYREKTLLFLVLKRL